MGMFLGVAKIPNIFGVLEIPDFFFGGGGGGVNGRCWVRVYVWRKNRVSPLPLG